MVFNFSNYKDYLHHLVRKTENSLGSQTKISKVMGCQSSYVSQVLNGTPHLSTDNISRLCDYLLFSDDEKEYLLNLLLMEKSACKSLIKFLKKKNQSLHQKNCQLKEKLKIQTKKNKLFSSNVYYSKYIFSAIHILLTIEKYQSIDALSQKLSLSPMQVKQYIDDLCKIGILIPNKSFYQVSNTTVYGKNQNDFIRHHANWSSYLQHQLQKQGYLGLHYVDVVSISEKDYLNLKSDLEKFIMSFRKKITLSKEEEVYNLQIDFFPI